MTRKSILGTYVAEKIQMGDILVDQALPVQGRDSHDPFLLIHHGFDYLEAGSHPRDYGVGPHPHRGFSPVTFVIRGEVHHRDSRGNSSIVGAGGLQWMDAGMGIVHSERPSAEFALKGGPMEIVQCWINLPANNKFDKPQYFAAHATDSPKHVSADKLAELTVYSGNQLGITGPVQPKIPIEAYRLDIVKGGELNISLPANQHCVIYNLRDTIEVNGQRLFVKESMMLKADGRDIHFKAKGDTICVILSGEPLGEKVTKYGPFVMNTQTEVMEALRDSQMGKMGILIEEF